MTVHPRVLCAALGVFASSCATVPPQAGDFESSIARIRQSEPASPAVLSAELVYAEFLMSAAPGPCAGRLAHAGQLLDSIDTNPKARAMFPHGWARAISLEYRLHLARAACGGETARAAELSAAGELARRGVEHYRKAFDYRSMVMMQADLAEVLHQRGENGAALAALQTALDMDRECGFRDYARESTRLLLTWQSAAPEEAQLDRLMQDFPKRSAVLTFGWRSSDARTSLDSHRVSLHDGQIVASHAAEAFLTRVSAGDDGSGWSVSHTQRLRRYDPGVWPTMEGLQQPPQGIFLPGAPPPADFKISAAGDFEGVTDETGVFAAHLIARTEQLIHTAAPPGDATPRLTSQAVERTRSILSAGMLEGSTAEHYQLETAMWIGATLEQGVWYETAAALSLAGLPGVVVPHRIEFAFTRMVPCTAGAAAPSCVELVLHAVPDPQALHQLVADRGIAAYSASSDYRIVTDPATLVPYAREERLGWYASRNNGIRGSDLGSERLVSTTSYGADPAASPGGVKWPDRGPL